MNIDRDQIQAQLDTTAQQRNAALNQVAELAGQLAVAQRTIRLLTENGDRLVAEAEEAKSQLDGMPTIVGLL